MTDCRLADCRVAAPDHPFDGQAGPPADPAGPRSDPETAAPVEVARTRAPDAPAGPADVERPAPRDQPEAALADPFDDAAAPGLGGRSSGGAVRPPPSASGVVLLGAWPAVPPRGDDPASFAASALLFAAIAALASYLPARRATRVDPTEALRYE